MKKSYSQKVIRIWSVLFPLTLINFSIFAVINTSIGEGGIPEVLDGGYFLNDHLHYTAVSKTIFFYTVVHLAITAVSFVLTGILSIFAFAVFGTLNLKKLSPQLGDLGRIATKLQVIAFGFVVLMFLAVIYSDFLK